MNKIHQLANLLPILYILWRFIVLLKEISLNLAGQLLKNLYGARNELLDTFELFINNFLELFGRPANVLESRLHLLIVELDHHMLC